MRKGGSRKSGALFVAGISIGFIGTIFLSGDLSNNNAPDVKSRSKLGSLSFIPDAPDAPHSHGDLDGIGVADTQEWNDFEDDSHRHEGETLASALKKQVRVLCWVMTNPFNIESKAQHVKATWGRRCNVLVFMSSIDDPSLPAVGLHVPEGHDFLWAKTKAAFKYVFDHYFTEADWFFKVDDDTYVVMENLRYFLKDYNPDDPLYFGRRFRPYVEQGYMSGGAGYVLSREALRRFVTLGLPSGQICSTREDGVEDLEMGICLQGVGVRAVDSRDELGRERFHPFPPDMHLIPGAIPRDNWFWDYNYYPSQKGLNCCSDYAITFHYISPPLMYLFEYFVYHMKPFGILSSLVIPKNGSRLQYGPLTSGRKYQIWKENHRLVLENPAPIDLLPQSGINFVDVKNLFGKISNMSILNMKPVNHDSNLKGTKVRRSRKSNKPTPKVLRSTRVI